MPHFLPDALSSPYEIEQFANVELVVLDLDGTLLNDQADLPGVEAWEKRFGLVDRLKMRGVPLIVATGRAFHGARRIVEAVARNKNLPFIFYNGSLVAKADGKIIGLQAIDENTVDGLRDLVMAHKCEALLYSLSLGHSNYLAQEHVEYVGEGIVPDTEFNGLQVGLGKEVFGECVAALIWTDSAAKKGRIAEELKHRSGLDVTASGDKYLEIKPRGASKASGLDVVLNNLNISRERALAIGDNDNDIELLSDVGISVCVANASPKAKKVCRYCARYPASSGAIETLDLIVRAKRLFSTR